jgi:hypothetical protein
MLGICVQVRTSKHTSTLPPRPDWWNARVDKILVRQGVQGARADEARVFVTYQQAFGVYANYPGRFSLGFVTSMLTIPVGLGFRV